MDSSRARWLMSEINRLLAEIRPIYVDLTRMRDQLLQDIPAYEACIDEHNRATERYTSAVESYKRTKDGREHAALGGLWAEADAKYRTFLDMKSRIESLADEHDSLRDVFLDHAGRYLDYLGELQGMVDSSASYKSGRQEQHRDENTIVSVIAGYHRDSREFVTDVLIIDRDRNRHQHTHLGLSTEDGREIFRSDNPDKSKEDEIKR